MRFVTCVGVSTTPHTVQQDKDYKPAYWIPIHNGSSIERQEDELVITSFSDANHFNARVKIESPGDVETWNAFLRLAKDSK